MTITELKEKWAGLSESIITKGFRLLRLSPDCICELFIGVSKENKRCLILALPDNKQLKFKGIQKENLSIDYYLDNNLITLQLIDNQFFDLFDDLVLSLYQGIKGISNADEYSNYFIQAFYRWSEFFEDKKTDLLPENEIKGLIGELLILKILIIESKGHEINSILNSWKGPYDKGNDFELEDKNMEVKTKSSTGIDVKISSEFQLELSYGKSLELVVVSLLNDYINGITIKELANEIKTLVQNSFGDSSILWKALKQKNITSKNIGLYDQYRFKPVNYISYDCNNSSFPKLNRSNIPLEINTLKYNLRTSLLTKFIIKQNNF